jgi:IMP dehydrogenase
MVCNLHGGHMRIVSDIMTQDVVTIGILDTVESAVALMRRHYIDALPVVDGDAVVGLVTSRDLLGVPAPTRVEEVMSREFTALSPEATISEAAEAMHKSGSGRLLVMLESRLLGILTRGDLLPEMGKSLDQLTDLPRADALRDWGIAALRSGHEISILFIDLDNFGALNKNYGHVVGDGVLRHVAKVLRSRMDADRDLLCRYGGDEFVIVTTRNASESVELSLLLREALRTSESEDLPQPITGSIGVHGGKRAREREDIHFHATLDNLINLASRACTLSKARTQ